MTVSLSNHLAADSASAGAAPRRVRRPDPDAEVVAAQVVLRLGRQRPVRSDHPAAGVLPDPRRGGDPPAIARREIAAASGADTLVELGSGTSEKTRMLLDALRDRGSLRRFIPFDVDAGVLQAASSAIVDEYPGIEIDAVCGDFEEHLGKIPAGRTATGGVPRLHDRQPDAGAARRLPGGAVRRRCNRATACCWAPTWSRTPAGWCAPTTTAPASRRAFNRNVLAVVNRELDADFDPRRVRARGPLEHRRGAHRDVAAGGHRSAGARRRARSRPSTSPPARRCSPRCPASSGRRGGRGVGRRPGLRRTHWWTDPGG